MKKLFSKIGAFFKRHAPSKRKLIQLYSALLFNCYLKGYITGDIFKGFTKNFCTPGLNCYSCPGAVTACPLGALQNAFADSGKRAPYYMLGIVMLYGVLLGRWICGWLCPFGFVQELLYKIKTPKIKKNFLTRVLSFLKYPVLILFAVLLPIIYMLRDFPLPAFCKYICPAGTFGGAIGLLINPANADKFGMLGGLFTWKFVLMVSILVSSVFIYRMFCRFLCPLGALYGLFNKIAVFGIKLEKKSCISCGKCVETCKMDIRHVGDIECISCGECIPVCPTKAISWKGKNIILPPSEIEDGSYVLSVSKNDVIKITEPTPAVEKVRAGIVKKRSRRVALITAAVSALLVLILGAAITYFNFIYEPPAVDNGAGLVPEPEDGGADGGDAVYGYEVGDLARPMELSKVLEDGSLSIEAFRGKAVVINFWGTWCGPCKEELPDFERLASEYEDAAFYIVHSVSGSESAKDYINDNFPSSNMNWVFDIPLTEGMDMYFALLGGSSYYPRTVVIDENGVITFAADSKVHYDELKREIEHAMGNEADSAKGEIDNTLIVIIDIVVTVLLALTVFASVYCFGYKKKDGHRAK